MYSNHILTKMADEEPPASLPFMDESNPPSPSSITSAPPGNTVSERANHTEVERILNLPTFPEQVDAFAELRGYFRPEPDSNSYASVTQYMAGSLSLSEAVNRIAEPIELAWTTGDHDPKFFKSESGKEPQFSSTEGYLWDLWYSVLHTAKRTPWTDNAAHEKLLNLVKALKERPDPERDSMLQGQDWAYDWVLGSDALWSNLLLLGPSSRESQNDSPGCGAGFQVPEQQAFANVNSFWARMTRDEVRGFWIYAIWALRGALEEKYPEVEKWRWDAWVPTAAMWVLILREKLWDKEEDLTPKNEWEGNPAKPGSLWKEGKSEFSKKRWGFWKQRFGEVACDEGLAAETRRIAGMTAMVMEDVERGR